jgi:DNA-binding transcriptional regulator LsrR (DeoR family)
MAELKAPGIKSVFPGREEARLRRIEKIKELYFMEGLSISLIAQRFGIQPNTVNGYLKKGVEK